MHSPGLLQDRPRWLFREGWHTKPLSISPTSRQGTLAEGDYLPLQSSAFCEASCPATVASPQRYGCREGLVGMQACPYPTRSRMWIQGCTPLHCFLLHWRPSLQCEGSRSGSLRHGDPDSGATDVLFCLFTLGKLSIRAEVKLKTIYWSE